MQQPRQFSPIRGECSWLALTHIEVRSLVSQITTRRRARAFVRHLVLPHTHTHTHTHTHIQLSSLRCWKRRCQASRSKTTRYVRAHTYTHTCAHTRTRTHTHTHIHTYTHTNARTHSHIQKHTCCWSGAMEAHAGLMVVARSSHRCGW